jgi:hypothetical protein
MSKAWGLDSGGGRIRIALIISGILNGFLVAASLSINPRGQDPTPMADRIIGVLTAPSTAFSEWIAPPGHGGFHFVIALIAAIISSILFYAVLAWVVLSLPAWWRHRS